MGKESRAGRPIDPPSQLLLDERGVAEVLAVSERKVRELRSSGLLPSVKLGKSRRFHIRDVERFADRLRSMSEEEHRQLVY